MTIIHHRSKKKATSGKYLSARKKRKYETGSRPTLTKVGERKTKTTKTKGGGQKTRLLNEQTVNILGKDKKYTKVKIKSVLENSANRHFVRRNIITKGSIVETEKGKARITSRPGQEGTLNAILVE